MGPWLILGIKIIHLTQKKSQCLIKCPSFKTEKIVFGNFKSKTSTYEIRIGPRQGYIGNLKSLLVTTTNK